MESKLNSTVINEYTESFVQSLTNDFFKQHSSMSGDDLLKIPVRQVGLFALRQIYSSWRREIDKLTSPYFNYDAADVKDGLNRLMNVLSRNISLSKETSEALLLSATNHTLLLIFSPFQFYKQLVEQLLSGQLDREGLEEWEKFTEINVGIFKRLISMASNQGFATEPTETLLNTLFVDAEMPQAIEDFVEKFSSISPLDPSLFLEQETSTAGEPTQIPSEETDSQPLTIHDSYTVKEQTTLADSLREQQTVGSIKSSLTINQKFMFINDLFDGNQDDFSTVLDFLDGCESFDVAEAFIRNNYFKHNRWKEEAPQVKEFMALIDKRFS